MVKNCPNCQTEPKSVEFVGIETCFHCPNCDFSGESAETPKEALQNWNNACLNEEVEKLKNRVFELEADIYVLRKKVNTDPHGVLLK